MTQAHEPDDRHDDAPSVTLIEGESGTARALTHEVKRLLDQRHVPYRTVPGGRLAHRSMALPTVIATFGDDRREVAYHGYGRICLDFLPLLGR